MLKIPSEQVQQSIRSLQHQDGTKALVEYLTAARGQCLDQCARAPEDLIVRRAQGAVMALDVVLDLLKPRTP